MERCPKCRFRSVRKVVDRHPDNPEIVLATASICRSCGHVLRSKVYNKRLWSRLWKKFTER